MFQALGPWSSSFLFFCFVELLSLHCGLGHCPTRWHSLKLSFQQGCLITGPETPRRPSWRLHENDACQNSLTEILLLTGNISSDPPQITAGWTCMCYFIVIWEEHLTVESKRNLKILVYLTHPARFARKVQIVFKGTIYNIFGYLMID